MKFLKNLKDFYYFNKEFNIPESKKYRDIVDTTYKYFLGPVFQDFSIERDKISSILKGIETESKKEYSELKYKLLDEYKIIYPKFSKLREKIIDDIVMIYYSKCKRNLFDDFEDVISWLPSSKYINEEDKKLMNNLYNALSDSDIKKNLDDLDNW